MPPLKPLRILFLHGFTQTPTLFSAKTAALRKALSKTFANQQGYEIHFSYPAGPHRVDPVEIPGYEPGPEGKDEPEALAWWIMRGNNSASVKDPTAKVIYDGVEKSMDAIADCIRRDGPFDGVIGFSQGAAAAAMVASLLEGTERFRAFENRSLTTTMGGLQYPASFLSGDRDGNDFIQPPLKFAVCYGGFKARDVAQCAAFYDPKIKTPILHVIGQVDVVVEEARSRGLIDVCGGGLDRIVIHPGGHFVPSQKPWLDAVLAFIKACVEGEAGKSKDSNQMDESAEDMDVPF